MAKPTVIDWPVERDPAFGCLRWMGDFDRDGYPRLVNGELAYHAVYESRHGPIPDGKELDHVCRRRWCVFHLEPVTRSQNELRKSWSYRVKINLCPRGHPLTTYTTMVTMEGGRVCRTCRDES